VGYTGANVQMVYVDQRLILNPPSLSSNLEWILLLAFEFIISDADPP
jgi:hypothetical protein